MKLGALWLALGLLATPEAPKSEDVTRAGTVVLLTDALKARGLAADAGPIADQVVVRAEDGTLTPLLPDEASRALFRDARLRDRKAEIRGRRVAGLPYLQVLSFRVEEQGSLRTPEYFCEVCTIAVRAPQTCPCCQGPMELRFQSR